MIKANFEITEPVFGIVLLSNNGRPVETAIETTDIVTISCEQDMKDFTLWLSASGIDEMLEANYETLVFERGNFALDVSLSDIINSRFIGCEANEIEAYAIVSRQSEAGTLLVELQGRAENGKMHRAAAASGIRIVKP